MAIKPNGEIVPPLKCATCPISSGCSWACLRGDDLAEIYVLRAALQLIDDYYQTGGDLMSHVSHIAQDALAGTR